MAMNPWIRCISTIQRPSCDLYCFPHAGAGASIYYRWGRALARWGVAVYAIQYPGREDRFNETPISNWHAMVRAISNEWRAVRSSNVPAIFFGHSMGALLAFEVCAQLTNEGDANAVARLFLSGRNPPHVPRDREDIHLLPREEFVRRLGDRENGYLPAEVTADPEVLSLFLPALRSDYKLVETYSWNAGRVVAIPIVAIGGLEDRWVKTASLSEWGRYTSRDIVVEVLKGDHFFHMTNFLGVTQLVGEKVSQGRSEP